MSTNITLYLHTAWTPRKQQEHDIILMDHARHQLPNWTWESINVCRLYLQAVALSDITSYDGVWISEKIYNAAEPLRQSRLNFPSQKKPTKSDFHYWQHFLNLFMSKEHRLHTPLGKWYPNPYQQFPDITDLETGDILQTVAESWYIYKPQGSRRNHYKKTQRMTHQRPSKWCPTHVIRTSDYIISLPRSCVYTPDPSEGFNMLGKFNTKHKRQVVG